MANNPGKIVLLVLLVLRITASSKDEEYEEASGDYDEDYYENEGYSGDLSDYDYDYDYEEEDYAVDLKELSGKDADDSPVDHIPELLSSPGEFVVAPGERIELPCDARVSNY